MNQILKTETSKSNWKSAYKMGGIAALLMFAITLVRVLFSLPFRRPQQLLTTLRFFKITSFLGSWI